MKELHITLAILLMGSLTSLQGLAQAKVSPPSHPHQTQYRKTKVEGTEIFYREAGNPKNPTILLLHGFPSSSHMYRNLIELLSPHYHLIAPDYPGFGLSGKPSPTSFDYSFDHIAMIMEKFIDQLKLRSINFYMQDYGGPVGFRIISKRPELVQSLIIQNANIFLEGLGPEVQKISALNEARDMAGLNVAIDYMMSLEGIKEQYIHGTSHPDLVSPDSYNMDYFIFQEPGVREIQKIIFSDYGNNFPKYPEWQKYLRTYHPNVLIAWGKNDKIFPGSGALAIKKTLPSAELNLFEGGHFLLEEYGNDLAALIHTFLKKRSVIIKSKTH